MKPDVRKTLNIATCNQASVDVCFCMVLVNVSYEEQQILTCTFLDQSSTYSFCDQKLIDALNNSGSPVVITLQVLEQSCKYLRRFDLLP